MWNVKDAVEPVPFDEGSYYQERLRFFARLRESRPVVPVRMPGYGRAWMVTRYADVRAALADPRLARDVRRWPGGARSRPSEATGVNAHMLHADPPDHARLRRLVQQAFAPRRAALRPCAEQVAADLLDKAAAEPGDVTDLLRAYARPLPIAVLSELLAIPAAGLRVARRPPWPPTTTRRSTRGWSGSWPATSPTWSPPGAPGPATTWCRRSPAPATTTVTDGAAGLTGPELLAAVFLLVMAGFDTTVNLIASGTLALLTHPGELARLRRDPSLLPAAVEELLRFTSPVNHTNDRFTTEDVRVGDVVIPAGEWVFLAAAR